MKISNVTKALGALHFLLPQNMVTLGLMLAKEEF